MCKFWKGSFMPQLRTKMDTSVSNNNDIVPVKDRGGDSWERYLNVESIPRSSNTATLGYTCGLNTHPSVGIWRPGNKT